MGDMKEKNTDKDRYLVPAVNQASQILFCLALSDSTHMSLIDICNQIGIHKSKAYSILLTLQKFGLIQRNVDGKGYALGPGLIALSRKVLENFNIPRLAEPALENLGKQTGGTATLGLIADDKVFVAAKYESSSDIGITVRVGYRFPLTFGSHGKAIAAFLPQEEFDNLIASDHLFFYGHKEKADFTKLKKELDQCRRDGFALGLGEITPGVNTVAAPVFGSNSHPIGYITVLGLFNAETAKKHGPLVSEAAKKLSEQLGHGANGTN